MRRVVLSLLFSKLLMAHHGVASVGVAGLEGPGAPIETTSSATLPKGSFLGYMKMDYASYERYSATTNDELKSSNYGMYGLGYGFSSYFSGYLFVPYYSKHLKNGVKTSGIHDINLMAVLGFKYDEGFRLVSSSESLDDLEDWHFTLFANATLPTGDSELKQSDGTLFDSGMQLGFGEPSFMVGASATKWFGEKTTLVFDSSYNTFEEHRYSDATRVKFADEIRANTALTYKLYAKDSLRLDVNIEANYLHLGRDKFNGIEQEATGGEVLYGTFGFRLFYKDMSGALGLKLPVATNLNEASSQQGSEGKENYRLLFSLSKLF